MISSNWIAALAAASTVLLVAGLLTQAAALLPFVLLGFGVSYVLILFSAPRRSRVPKKIPKP